MKTRCIVNPGRSVRFEGKRHTEGAVLMLGQQDVRQLTEMGVVRVAEPEADPQAMTTQGDQDGQTSVVSLTAEQTALAIDAMAAAVASGELQPAADQPVADAVKTSPAEATQGQAPTPAPAPSATEPEAKRPAAKKAARSRG